ncbi:hypothetical protein PtA15_6A498 [Puccinia triticina]|uniref:Uncharacterized protein n=1 Tax=Puccinia triticina TaxID=208348 RepID=A0ABY7CMH9_9BASI|nr:uncharacterized protein PtA15_6A498 [Puccinia triticina]WAQ85869.1 hypothetical protein PtA15_6A498 [Puccinia triticina]WAR55761.1 hypothetical protein PtB15_6B504 [Puccinia triticina]
MNDTYHPAGKRPTTASTSKIQLANLTTKTGFKFPSIFSFPPFFTKQPNQQTWAHQASLWQQIILSYCKYHRVFKLDISGASTVFLEESEMFSNPLISSTAEYYPTRPSNPTKLNQGMSTPMATKTYILIHYDSPTTWADRIYEYISSNGLTNSVMTLHELTSPDHQPSDQPLVGLDPIILRKALGILVKGGKAKLFKGSIDGVAGDGDGVKFF